MNKKIIFIVLPLISTIIGFWLGYMFLDKTILEITRLKEQCEEWDGYFMISKYKDYKVDAEFDRVYCWKQEPVQILFDYNF